MSPDRRQFLAALAALGLAGPAFAAAAPATGEPRLGRARAFSWNWLVGEACKLAASPWATPDLNAAQVDYDMAQRMVFRDDRTRWPQSSGVRFFPRGVATRRSIAMNVVENGRARAIVYDPALFDIPSDHGAIPDGFSGFRVMNADASTGDWLAFLGASYFRTAGPFNQYGLSARGIAIDTALSRAEEFPDFTSFWLERGASADEIIVYAMLDGPSVTGAYRFVNRKGEAVHSQDVTVSLFFRKDVERLGLAPLTSMFWYDEGNRDKAADWRPEIHDTDGLALANGRDEQLFRPLNNPPAAVASSFADENPKGYGLVQRDRNFDHYQDDGVFYERRPSLWVEPKGDWGRGAVTLFEIPTRKETEDNIVLFWTPEQQPKAGEQREYGYRLEWRADAPRPAGMARVVDVWRGSAGRPGYEPKPGQVKLVIDFTGDSLDGLDRSSGVRPDVSALRGGVTELNAYPVVGQAKRWRLVVDVAPSGPEPVELRAQLTLKGLPLTETCLYQLARVSS